MAVGYVSKDRTTCITCEKASFAADGTSTGGLWTLFPGDDHESIAGLVLTGDEVLYPAPEEDA